MSIVILFIVVTLCHLYCVTKLRRLDEIHDIGHSIVPILSSRFKSVPDLIVVIVFLWSAFLYRQNLTPLLTAHIVVILLRIVTMHMTVLPPVRSFECTNRHPIDCTQDYLFSGHTAMTVTSLLFIATVYEPRSLYVPLALAGILQMLVIISLRMHYTIDVFLGALLSFFVFYTGKKLM
jgi:membrane-associated phospholipid phosphatase